jgi:hypothetical protein
VLRAAALLLLTAVGAGPAGLAQEVGRENAPRRASTLSLEAGSGRTPVVRAENLLGDGVFEAALANGFPVRYQFRLELWRDGTLFDNLESEAAWDAVIHLDPVTGRYTLLRSGGVEERFATSEALDRALSVPYTVDLQPPSEPAGRRYYYVASLAIESLSLSDLEEVERWLRGDLEPAIRSSGEVGNALGRGARRLLIRLSGLPRRRLEVRSPPFRPAQR